MTKEALKYYQDNRKKVIEQFKRGELTEDQTERELNAVLASALGIDYPPYIQVVFCPPNQYLVYKN